MPSVEQYIGEAAKELGYTESPPGSNNNKFAAEAGHANRQPWCATFIVALAKRTGLLLPSTSAYTPTMANAFKSSGQWGTTPTRGAFAFFDFPDSTTRIQHIGVVEKWDVTNIQTIDGNTSASVGGSEDNGGGVFRRLRNRRYVVGYGYPIYSEERAKRVYVDWLIDEQTGGVWKLKSDGGVEAHNGAPFLGSYSQIAQEGQTAVSLTRDRGGYAFMTDKGLTYHFPRPGWAPQPSPSGVLTKEEVIAEVIRRLES